MNRLTPKQKSIAILGGIVLVMLVISTALLHDLLGSGKTAHDTKPSGAVQDIPDAELEQTDRTKTGSYSGGGAPAMWDALAREEEEDDDNGRRQIHAEERQEPDGGIEASDLLGDGALFQEPEEPRRQQSAYSGKPKAEPKEEKVVGPKEEPAGEAPAQVRIRRSDAVSSLEEEQQNIGFSSLDSEGEYVDGGQGHAYRCMFMRSEKIHSGQRISVRLLEDMVVGGTLIPQNTHLQASVTISGRVDIHITSIDIGGRILPLSLDAFDTDGSKGIYCSDLSEAGQKVRQQVISTGSSLLSSRLGRIAGDAAQVGLAIARSKSGEVTVQIPAGYTFYVIENTENQIK